MSFKLWNSYWEFNNVVKNKSRFIFDEDSTSFLKAIKDTCKSRVITIPMSEPLWRAQIGCSYEPLIQDGIHVDDLPIPFEFDRMKPINDFASEGRANPKGIPYLYVATDKETAMSEVRPSLGEIISVGRFSPIKELKIIDFSIHNGKFYVKTPTQKDIDEAVWRDMDKAFSIPVTNSNFHPDYVPTQVIAELIKSLGYDGIAYKSSLAQGKNITLFDLESASILECDIFKLSKIDYKFNEELNQFTRTY